MHNAAALSSSTHDAASPSTDGAAAAEPSNEVQLGLLLGSSVLLQLGAGMIVPCLPAYAQSLGLPASSVGFIVAVPTFARACINLPAGRVADLVGRKRPMVVGSVLDGIGCLGTAMAGGLPSMAASRLVMGGGSAIAGNATEAYTMDVVNRFPSHKGRIMGVRMAAVTLAWVAGPVLGGYLGEAGGIGLPFMLVGGAILGTVPLMQRLLPETPPAVPGSDAALRLRPLLEARAPPPLSA